MLLNRNTVSLLFLIILFNYVVGDYYRLLGVPRDASEAQIKKAFKKLSLKYHPDKNKNNQEQAKQKFAQIVNAYETLKDKEKREVYDRHGEEGVKQHEAQKQQGGEGFHHHGGFQHGNFDDIFNQFFGHQRGGGGGGGEQHFSFHFGGGGHQQQNVQQQPEKLFEQSDVIDLNLGSLSQYYRRREVWVLLFYVPDQKAKEIKDVYKELAEKYYGIFKCAAINCQENEELCEDEFSVHLYPKILVAASNMNDEPKKYSGPFEVSKIASFAVQSMESFVELITDETYDQFIKKNEDKNKVILFTSQKSTPPLLRALSKDLKGKLVFGEVRASEQKLMKQFQIEKYPTLLALTDPENYLGNVYEGANKKDQIMKFLREYAYVNPKKTQKSKSVSHLTPFQLRHGNQCGVNDKNLCLLAIIKNTEDEALKTLQNLAGSYKDDPINFYYLTGNEIDYQQVFPNVENLPAILIIRGKRSRYTKLNNQNQLNHELIKNFIDETISGSSSFQPLKLSLEDAFDRQKQTDL